jgi:hypothetical protein
MANHKYDLCSDKTWMLNKPRKSFVQPMKFCLPWLNSCRCHTQLYARLWKYLTVTANWLISVCGFCLCGIRSWKSYVWWFLWMKEFFNLLQRCWLGETGPIPWPGSSCEFTPLDNVFRDYVAEQIYIWPYGILLMETHTEIEHFLRPALFMDCSQHTVVIPFRHFGINSQSHIQGSSCPRRICLDSRQPKHTWCLLGELTFTELI